MTTIAIHQPGYLPWLPFFKKIIDAELFVFLDDVQYEKNGFQNRNKIRTSTNSTWLTVPVHAKLDSNLNEIKIDTKINWSRKHKKTLQTNYSNSQYFEEIWKYFESIYDTHFDFLIELNMKIIKIMMELLCIRTKTVLSSELNISGKGSKRIMEICKMLDADTYISGTGLPGKKYLEIDDFAKNNINIKFYDFQYPVYHQCYEPFMPNLSTIDLLFNEGKNSKDILLNAKISSPY